MSDTENKIHKERIRRLINAWCGAPHMFCLINGHDCLEGDCLLEPSTGEEAEGIGDS